MSGVALLGDLPYVSNNIGLNRLQVLHNLLMFRVFLHEFSDQSSDRDIRHLPVQIGDLFPELTLPTREVD